MHHGFLPLPWTCRGLAAYVAKMMARWRVHLAGHGSGLRQGWKRNFLNMVTACDWTDFWFPFWWRSVFERSKIFATSMASFLERVLIQLASTQSVVCAEESHGFDDDDNSSGCRHMMERPDPQKSRGHAACFNLPQCIIRKLLGHQNPMIKRALTNKDLVCASCRGILLRSQIRVISTTHPWYSVNFCEFLWYVTIQFLATWNEGSDCWIPPSAGAPSEDYETPLANEGILNLGSKFQGIFLFSMGLALLLHIRMNRSFQSIEGAPLTSSVLNILNAWRHTDPYRTL